MEALKKMHCTQGRKILYLNYSFSVIYYKYLF